MAQYTVNLPCVADTYTDYSNPNTNYGTQPKLYCGGAYRIPITGGYAVEEMYKGVLQFNWTGLPLHKKIISSQLYLYSLKSITWLSWDVKRGGVYALSEPFIETQLTHANGNIAYQIYNIPNFPNMPLNAWVSINLASTEGSWPVDHDRARVNGISIVFRYEKDGYPPPGYDGMGCEFSSREGSYPPYLRITYEDSPPLQPVNLAPVGAYVDAAQDIRMSWNYLAAYGGEQKSYQLMWSADDGVTWNTINQTTPNNYHDIPANTFPVGNIRWRVRTYNEYDEASPWSSDAVFYAVAAPDTPQTRSVTNVARPMIEWNASGQQAYEVRVLIPDELEPDTGELIYTSGEMPGIAARRHKVAAFLSNGAYIAQVRVKNEFGLWSKPGVQYFDISVTPPPSPSIATQQTADGIAVHISDAVGAEYFLIYRDGVCVAKTDQPVYHDTAAVCGREHTYFARAVGAGDAFADSLHKLATPRFQGGRLSPVSNLAHVIRLDKSLVRGFGRAEQHTPQTSLTYFAGRELPVAEYSSHVSRELTLEFFVRSYSEVERLYALYDRHEALIYRDSRGRKLFGAPASLSIKEQYPGYAGTLGISAVDHKEEVEP